MADKTNKSHFTQKQFDKEEKVTSEELELKRYDIIFKGMKEAIKDFDRNDRSIHKEPSKKKDNNKSNFSSPTTSRIKEDMSEKDFLTNFMNIDDHSNILPKNMHLLTDNDTNQNISAQEKYKNLSNLMMDDKNITELNFIRNNEERIKLNLYLAFSKKAKDIFIDDDHQNRTKNQILFHKINEMHIPKFEFKPSIAHNEAMDTNLLEKSIGLESNKNLNSNNAININEKNKDNKDKSNNEKNENINKEEWKKEEKDEKKFTECYFRQETKGFFHIPSLSKIELRSQQKKESRKQRILIGIKKLDSIFKKDNTNNKKNEEIFWDPEIDAETLAYINHNFISIEDIYNKKNNDVKKDNNNNPIISNDEDEPNLTPIKAKEIFYDNEKVNNFLNNQDRNEEDGENGEGEKLKYEVKNDNKFIEFIAIKPEIIKVDYSVLPHAKEEMRFELELKKDFKEKINMVSDIDANEFPRNAKYKAKKIERILRFQKLVKQKREIDFTLNQKTTTDESANTIKEFDNNNNEKTEKNENIIPKMEIKTGEIKTVNENKALKDKSFSDIIEKKSILDEEEKEEDSKNSFSLNSHISQNSEKSSKLKVFNFNDDNDNSEHSQFCSEKS